MKTVKTTLTERLELAMKGPPKVTGSALAKACGIKQPSVSDWVTGTTKTISGENLIRAAACLSVNPRWLATGQGPMRSTDKSDYIEDSPQGVPVWDARAAAGISAVNEHGVTDSPITTIYFRPNSLKRKGIEAPHVFFADGDSMMPRISDGDAILFNHNDTTIRSGKIYVFQYGEDTLVKRLYKEPDGSIRVVSDNKSNPEYADWKIPANAYGMKVLGRLRWIGSWED